LRTIIAPVDVDPSLSDTQRACFQVAVRPPQPADLLAPQPEQRERETPGEAVGRTGSPSLSARSAICAGLVVPRVVVLGLCSRLSGVV
jgi:hypothetical protein